MSHAIFKEYTSAIYLQQIVTKMSDYDIPHLMIGDLVGSDVLCSDFDAPDSARQRQRPVPPPPRPDPLRATTTFTTPFTAAVGLHNGSGLAQLQRRASRHTRLLQKEDLDVTSGAGLMLASMLSLCPFEYIHNYFSPVVLPTASPLPASLPPKPDAPPSRKSFVLADLANNEIFICDSGSEELVDDIISLGPPASCSQTSCTNYTEEACTL